MGMTIADNIDFLNEAKKLFEDIANNPSINETVKTYCVIESLESAIEIMRKYQQLQSDYENRLKADLKAILVELQLEIEEIEIDVPFGFEPVSKTSAFYEGVSASSRLIQQKINALKENTDGME